MTTACSKLADDAAESMARKPFSARRAATGRLPWVAAGVLLSASAVGCGGGGDNKQQTVETATVQRSIAASILTQRHVPTNVKCPTKVPSAPGVGFTCVAKLDVGSYPVAVIVKDNKGHVRYGNQAPLVVLDVAKVESAIARSIQEQRQLTAAVKCPAHVLQQNGLKFVCSARVAGKAYPFAVEQIDSRGHVRYLGR